MKFRLHFQGKLRADDRHGKSEIRRHFSEQLRYLWQQQPLKDIAYVTHSDRGPETCCVRISRGIACYIPIATTKLSTVAELDILVLRPGQPGDLLNNGADIDNRLKTLLDALQPPHENASDEEGEIFCLLEDDKLVTRLSVETDRLLREVSDQTEVFVIVTVNVRPTRGLTINMGLAG